MHAAMSLRSKFLSVICTGLISLVFLLQAAGASSKPPPPGSEQADRSTWPGLPHAQSRLLTTSLALDVADGAYHTCAVTALGGVRCWGNNDRGQLGDGTYVSTTLPVNVVGLSAGVQAMTAGHAHNCALPGGGGMECWGHASHGQLGDGSASLYPFPVGVQGFQGQDVVWLPLIQQ
jgi:hypothetical protein